jgi:hypothetical protein
LRWSFLLKAAEKTRWINDGTASVAGQFPDGESLTPIAQPASFICRIPGLLKEIAVARAAWAEQSANKAIFQ